MAESGALPQERIRQRLRETGHAAEEEGGAGSQDQHPPVQGDNQSHPLITNIDQSRQEVAAVLGINSLHSKRRMLQHPNIRVIRHPDHTPGV